MPYNLPFAAIDYQPLRNAKRCETILVTPTSQGQQVENQFVAPKLLNMPGQNRDTDYLPFCFTSGVSARNV
jgi:hypothetical protein